jgi:hypothetical protein
VKKYRDEKYRDEKFREHLTSVPVLAAQVGYVFYLGFKNSACVDFADPLFLDFSGLTESNEFCTVFSFSRHCIGN